MSDNSDGAPCAYYPRPTDAEVESWRVYCRREAAEPLTPVPLLDDDLRGLPRLMEHYKAGGDQAAASICPSTCAHCGCAALGGEPCGYCYSYLAALALPDSVAADGCSPAQILRAFKSYLKGVDTKRRQIRAYWAKAARHPRSSLQQHRRFADIQEGLFVRDVQ